MWVRKEAVVGIRGLDYHQMLNQMTLVNEKTTKRIIRQKRAIGTDDGDGLLMLIQVRDAETGDR